MQSVFNIQETRLLIDPCVLDNGVWKRADRSLLKNPL